MFDRVIEVQGIKEENRPDESGDNFLYARGTYRVVQQYNIFPKVLESKRSGWFSAPFVLQRADIISVGSPIEGAVMDVNKWRDVRFIRKTYSS